MPITGNGKRDGIPVWSFSDQKVCCSSQAAHLIPEVGTSWILRASRRSVSVWSRRSGAAGGDGLLHLDGTRTRSTVANRVR